MNKFFSLFAMLMMVSIAFAQDPILNLKDTVDVTGSDVDFRILNGVNVFGDFSSSFTFMGYSDDSLYRVSLTFKTADFKAGTYPDSLIGKSESTFSQVKPERRSIILNNGLGDAVVTITNDSITDYYNVKYSFVGDDSVRYNLDLTFHVPYEKSYIETTTSVASLTKNDYKPLYYLRFNDSDYRYELRLNKSNSMKDTVTITNVTYSDTAFIYIYDITDTNCYNYIHESYSGWIAKTAIDSTTFTVVGEVIIRGDVKFYFNTKKPTAVEEVVMPNYNVFTEANAIIVNGAEGNRAVIYDANGRLVASTKITTDNARFTVATGVYFVRINGVTTKVIVK